jgi:TonB family protein
VFESCSACSKRTGNGWLASFGIHIAGAMILVHFGGAIVAPPAYRKSATLVFIPPPPADVIEGPTLPRPKLKTFRIPDIPAPPKLQIVQKPALLESPVIQPAAPQLAARTNPSIAIPPPPPKVKTGVLDAEQAPIAPTLRPPSTVQTGIFSQPVQDEPELSIRTAPQTAGFDPTSKLQNEPKRPDPVTVAMGAFGGEGSSGQRIQNEPKSVSTGAFGGAGVSTRSTGSSTIASKGAASGFGDATVATALIPNRPTPQRSDSTPLEITFKPRPEYTPQARLKQVEGEVAVEAVFKTSGEVEVVRIIRGLGHGLNESAVAAVRAIRFRPAKQNGQLVDSIATVRMTFELAY